MWIIHYKCWSLLSLLHKNLKLFLGGGGKLYQWLRLIGHTSSFTIGGETEGAQGPLGTKRPWWSNLRPDRPTSYADWPLSCCHTPIFDLRRHWHVPFKLHSYAVRLWFSAKISAERYFKIPHFLVPSRALFSQFLI